MRWRPCSGGAPRVCLFSGPGEDGVDEEACCVDDGEFVRGGWPVRPPPLLVGRGGPLDDVARGAGGGVGGVLAPAFAPRPRPAASWSSLTGIRQANPRLGQCPRLARGVPQFHAAGKPTK